LAWNPSTDNVGVLNYTVWAPGVMPVWAMAPQTNATVFGLHPGTTYAWRVQAWYGMNWSLPSGIVDAMTAPDRCGAVCAEGAGHGQ
jgi:hypothetical protein